MHRLSDQDMRGHNTREYRCDRNETSQPDQGRVRAAVLGANDGIVSPARLIVGVATAAVTQGVVLISGSGLVASSMSMDLRFPRSA